MYEINISKILKPRPSPISYKHKIDYVQNLVNLSRSRNNF